MEWIRPESGKDCYRCVTISPSEIGVSQGQRVEPATTSAAPEAQHPTIHGMVSPLARPLREGAQIACGPPANDSA